MHWVIDRMISNEVSAERLLAALDEARTPYTLVKKPPFADHIVSVDDNDKPLDLQIEGPVFVSGSTAMMSVSKARGWSPGYIDAPSLDECLDHWHGHMLNSDLYTGPLATIRPAVGAFFIRPVNDGKAFAGSVLNPDKFDAWKARLLDGDGYAALSPDTQVAIASVKSILREYRCLVVDGEFITASRYKVGQRVSYSPGAPGEIASFVQSRADEWSPRRAFILDVAETDHGVRIVENNSVSSAGFYAMDMHRYVTAINRIGS